MIHSLSAVILEPKKIKYVTVSTSSPIICCEVMGPDAMAFVFWAWSFKLVFSLSFITFIKRFFHYFSLSAIRVVSSVDISEVVDISPGYLNFSLSFMQSIIFMMYSAYKLNKQGGNIQLCYSFPNLNQSVVSSLILTIASESAYRFLRRQISQIILYIWKFLAYRLLKPSLKNFEHDLIGMWNEFSWAVNQTFFALPFFEIGMKTELLQSCGHCWVFQIHTECSILTISSFQVLNSSAGILPHLLALFIVMLLKAHLTSHSKISNSKWVTILPWFCESLALFCIVLLCILATSS